MKGKKTGGRVAGIPNKRSTARQKAFEETKAKIEKALGKATFQGDAHALMVAVYKDESQSLAIRLDAAKAAAPYEKQRLAVTTIVGGNGAPLIPDVDRGAVLREVQQLIAREKGLKSDGAAPAPD